jgi:predicted metalloprotease with PDZ domain
VYAVSWDDPASHLFDVSIRFTARQRVTDLHLPAWRPGRYLIQNYAANVRSWSATANGAAVAVTKVAKSTWRIEAKRGAEIEMRYRFFAGVLDAGSSFLDSGEAYFNGSNLLMMIEGQRDETQRLELKVPRGWKVATQLQRIAAGVYEARDYDYLIDSPVVISPSLVTESFNVGKHRIELVFQDPQELDTAALAEATRPIVEQQRSWFGELPFQRYTFLYHLGTVWHGVEHEDSTSIILKETMLRGAKRGEEGFDLFLAITAHEFFHLWNVKRIFPKVFDPYDYSQETPTRLLWVMEGVTSYFGELTLVRSGLWSELRYLEHLVEEITALENAPARETLTLSQASFDGWLQEPAQMHDKANAWISFYNKGEIVAALLDLVLIDATNGRKSLVDVMRLLWRDYGKRRRGLPENAFREAVEKVARRDLSEFFDSFVDGTAALPYEKLFERAGVSFRVIDEEAAPLEVDGRFVVTRASAGFLAGDEIIAVDGLRITTAEMLRRALEAGESKTAEVVFARRGRMESRTMKRGTTTKKKILLSFAEGDERSNKLRSRWLGESM